VILGRKSTLFLVYAYRIEGKLAALKNWKQRRIEGAALLPHLDEYVRKGELMRAYDVTGDLRAAFGPRDPWEFTDGEKSIAISVCDPPRLYVLDTGYAFIVLGVTPPGETLAQFQDTAYSIVRAGASRVAKPHAQMRKWLETNGFEDEEPLVLRRWLARLVPDLPASAPRGTPRTTAPQLLSVALSKEPFSPDDLHRLRLVHRSDQLVEPSSENGARAEFWRVSSRELCTFSAFGFSWLVHDDDSQFLGDAPHMIRDRYVYKWLLVEHQRLCLLALATECADMSKGLDDSNFAQMRMRLLKFIATYNFRHISNEERHNLFYTHARDSLGIDDLLTEVREEVVEIDTQLAARRSETLNHVIAFLTLVLTPVGIVVGVFQSDTLPGKFRVAHVISASAWAHLFTHGPFLMVLAAAAIGAILYVRVFGAHTVARTLRALFLHRSRDRDERL